MTGQKGDSEEEDKRREEAIASRPSLQPNFKTNGVSQSQLSKFHELHRRRMQIKAKSKMKTKEKGLPSKTSKPRGKSLYNQEHTEEISSKETDNSNSVYLLDAYNTKEQEETVAGHSILKKRQKLHWGLDTKERWERKANM